MAGQAGAAARTVRERGAEPGCEPHLPGAGRSRLARAGRRSIRSAPAPSGWAEEAFGLGIGAIGQQFADAAPRMGELIAAAGVVAYQPTEGGSVPDYLIGTAEQPASAVLGSGLVCEGGFETLSRFTKRPAGQPVPLSELARVCLDHSSSPTVGVVMLVEVAGLVGARLRRSPTDPAHPVRLHDARGARLVQHHAGAGARGHGGGGGGRRVATARPAAGAAAPAGRASRATSWVTSTPRSSSSARCRSARWRSVPS